MTSWEMILMLVALTLGTQLPRFIPQVLPKALLAHPILQKLNKMLPLVIMLLLVLTSLSMPTATNGYSLFFAQIVSLFTVVLSYKWLNNILLSVGLGILNVNLLLWIMG
ncbi:branched-chain amino acid transport [Pasteurellaceae bacterium Orientalotternb1]|nr:branched-chain amino acid transport [Pasteurellaceae bacterium Orientalotternb1]